MGKRDEIYGLECDGAACELGLVTGKSEGVRGVGPGRRTDCVCGV